LFIREENNMCNNEGCRAFTDTLCTIVKLQRQEQCFDNPGTCDRPYLGINNNSNTYNTRPVTFYSCPNYTLWTMPYTLNGTTGTSSVFRVEAVEDCCCTCRVLAPNPDTTEQVQTPYVATDSYFTLNLRCIGAMRCLDDTYIPCI